MSGYDPLIHADHTGRLRASAADRAATRQRAIARGECPECRGTGADPLSDNVNWLPCRTCHGSGRRK